MQKLSGLGMTLGDLIENGEQFRGGAFPGEGGGGAQAVLPHAAAQLRLRQHTLQSVPQGGGIVGIDVQGSFAQ